MAMALGLAVLAAVASTNWESPDLLKYGGFLTGRDVLLRDAHQRSRRHRNSVADVPVRAVRRLELSGPETVVLGALHDAGPVLLEQPVARAWRRSSSTSVPMARGRVAATERAYHASWMAPAWLMAHNVDPSVRLAAATCALFLMNTAPVALVIALAEETLRTA